MEQMTINIPYERPTRHTRKFYKDEIILALKQYLNSGGALVPDGDESLYGLEYRSDRKEYLTLNIDVYENKD